MPEKVPRRHDATLTRITLSELGFPATEIAFAGPQLILNSQCVVALCDVAEDMRARGDFSRESPPRVRSVQHLSRTVYDILESVRFEEMMSEWARIQLSIHPSAHFGCSFNWTRLCPLGLSDAWHLDAAPYTAVILLSEPEKQYSGGELHLFTKDPLQLWESLRTGNAPPETAIYHVPFTQAGEAFLFQGRAIPHSVRQVVAGSMPNLTGVREGRLTLAIGLYSPDRPEFGLQPEGKITGGEEHLWRVESLRARVLASLDRLRRGAGWNADPTTLPYAAKRLTTLLDILEAAERAEGNPMVIPQSSGKD